MVQAVSSPESCDGTTDITRTFLFREPTDFEKEVYTRVLMGQINLAQAIWRRGLLGREIDAFARAPLWNAGLMFKHGTGHGIGHYLSVHEGPGRISNYHPRFEWDVPLEENMFFSNEPGYYDETKELGVRLENIIYITSAKTMYSNNMLGMETVTLFPYEPHMINFSLLNDKQRAWLNAYNAECLDKVGSLLLEQDDQEAYQWLQSRTEKVTSDRSTASTAATNAPSSQGWIMGILLLYSVFML